ncbi:hypothetical protein EJ06DRAFT_283621 [Trichodelitschia bisporula]|uniref:Uncharacterized protein n=1 Tax=Trichodelitschia bisporula TaxID=703511 RepID=A0A6G1I6G6_9PEZI|nr:hypothetical protein EJ06DRAFT_283621 [Trichodelitschia bisporula]
MIFHRFKRAFAYSTVAFSCVLKPPNEIQNSGPPCLAICDTGGRALHASPAHCITPEAGAVISTIVNPLSVPWYQATFPSKSFNTWWLSKKWVETVSQTVAVLIHRWWLSPLDKTSFASALEDACCPGYLVRTDCRSLDSTERFCELQLV